MAEKMYQVHLLIRSPVTGLAEWKAMRPSGHNARPYKWPKDMAERIARQEAKPATHATPPRTRIVEV